MATETVKSLLAFEETMFVFLIVHLNVVSIEGACQYVHFDVHFLQCMSRNVRMFL